MSKTPDKRLRTITMTTTAMTTTAVPASSPSSINGIHHKGYLTAPSPASAKVGATQSQTQEGAAQEQPQRPSADPRLGGFGGNMLPMAGYGGEFHVRKKLILCFDGTGNKFKGNSADTNILKIFRMLDRSGGEQCMMKAQLISQ